jgi:hypothetical protein
MCLVRTITMVRLAFLLPGLLILLLRGDDNTSDYEGEEHRVDERSATAKE